jgi:hypothetical protein
MARSTLERRIVVLEDHNPGRPYGHLTDEELDARIANVANNIEAEVGMDLGTYAAVLSDALISGEPLPDGVTRVEIQGLLASFRSVASTRTHHAQ